MKKEFEDKWINEILDFLKINKEQNNYEEIGLFLLLMQKQSENNGWNEALEEVNKNNIYKEHESCIAIDKKTFKELFKVKNKP